MSADRVAVDANILVYAAYRDTPQHAASRAWLERAVGGEVKICLTSQVLAEFFAIVTNAKRVSDPRTADEAVTAIEAALALPWRYVATGFYPSHVTLAGDVAAPPRSRRSRLRFAACRDLDGKRRGPNLHVQSRGL
jgi:predicted nucleic acid-binding protein